MDEVQVWIRKRVTGKGTTTYHGRWKDDAGAWHSRKLGTDEERAAPARGGL